MQQAAISPSDTGDHIHWLAELAPRAISPATGRNSRPWPPPGEVEAPLPSRGQPADRLLTKNDHAGGCSVVARMSRHGPVAADTNRH